MWSIRILTAIANKTSPPAISAHLPANFPSPGPIFVPIIVMANAHDADDRRGIEDRHPERAEAQPDRQGVHARGQGEDDERDAARRVALFPLRILLSL